MRGSGAGAGVPPGRVGSPAVECFGRRRLSRTAVVRARLRPGSTPAPAMCAGALLCHSAWCWWVALALAARGNRRIAEAEERMAGHGSRHGR